MSRSKVSRRGWKVQHVMSTSGDVVVKYLLVGEMKARGTVDRANQPKGHHVAQGLQVVRAARLRVRVGV